MEKASENSRCDNEAIDADDQDEITMTAEFQNILRTWFLGRPWR
jgi:hypothetical protein